VFPYRCVSSACRLKRYADAKFDCFHSFVLRYGNVDANCVFHVNVETQAILNEETDSIIKNNAQNSTCIAIFETPAKLNLADVKLQLWKQTF
jgi:hypothetical protein